MRNTARRRAAGFAAENSSRCSTAATPIWIVSFRGSIGLFTRAGSNDAAGVAKSSRVPLLGARSDACRARGADAGAVHARSRQQLSIDSRHGGPRVCSGMGVVLAVAGLVAHSAD